MAVVQSTFSETIRPAVAGMIANMETYNTVTRTVETAAGIAFGKPAFQGTADDEVAVTGTAILGITVRDVTLDVVNADKYVEGASAAVMTQGVIWVTAGEAVAAGDPVYVTAADGTFKKTASGNVAMANARFDTSASNGGLVKVAIR